MEMAEKGVERKGRRKLGRLGVCTWSLQVRSVAELVEQVRQTGLRAVQIALDPVRRGEMPMLELSTRLHDAGIVIASGVVDMAGEDYSTLDSIRRTGGLVPDSTWPANLAAAAENAEIARSLGIGLVTFHAGFIPHEVADPQRSVLIDRLRQFAATFGECGLSLALETGQESAQILLELLPRLEPESVGVNFDPANMILYGMGDPIDALRSLVPYVRQVHIKDALPAARPGEWGREVPVGDGDVDWAAFLDVLETNDLAVDMMIEREAGEDRVADIRRARALIERELGAAP